MSPNELSELIPLAKTLNEESNDLNKTITALNQHLGGLNLGIEVWLNSDDDSIQIGFGKIRVNNDILKHKWELAIRTKVFNGSGFQQPRPLLDASRDLRIEGLRSVPELLSHFKAATLDKIRVMQEAKKLAADLSADLSPPPAPRGLIPVPTEQPSERKPRGSVFSEGTLAL